MHSWHHGIWSLKVLCNWAEASCSRCFNWRSWSKIVSICTCVNMTMTYLVVYFFLLLVISVGLCYLVLLLYNYAYNCKDILKLCCSLFPERSYAFFWLRSLTTSDQFYPETEMIQKPSFGFWKDWSFSSSSLFRGPFLRFALYSIFVPLASWMYWKFCSLSCQSTTFSWKCRCCDFHLLPYFGPLVLYYIGKCLMLSAEVLYFVQFCSCCGRVSANYIVHFYQYWTLDCL